MLSYLPNSDIYHCNEPAMLRIVLLSTLPAADLLVDAVYEGSIVGNPLSQLSLTQATRAACNGLFLCCGRKGYGLLSVY